MKKREPRKGYRFGENVNYLVFARDEVDVQYSTSNYITDKMKVDFNMFGFSMEN